MATAIHTRALAQPAPALSIVAARPRGFIGTCSALIVWGVVSFGAVYDWALWPLVLASAIAGGILIVRQRTGIRVLLAASPILIAGIAQLLPVRRSLLAALSQATETFLARFDIAFAVQSAHHSLSLSPDLTARALLACAAFAVLVAGVSAPPGRSGDAMRLARVITAVAVPVALLAIVQKSTSNGKIYWLWSSEYGAANNYYGPFVNRNHFAGWMLLASALTGGFLLSQIALAGRWTKPGWRNRVLWLASEEAGRIVITASALLVMLVSTMWSMSRSGIAGTAVALAVLVYAAFRKGKTGLRRPAAVASIVILLLMAVSWRGADVLGDWYGKTNTFAWRVQLWKDTAPALKDFWVTGSGLNTYDRVMQAYPQTDYKSRAVQAHNDYLQLAVEGGLLVGIPVLITIALFVRTVARRLRQPQEEATWWIRMGAVAGICGMALQEFTEFSLQIPGVAVLFAILVGIAIHEPAIAERRRSA